MSRGRSPGYPNFGLEEALKRAQRIFSADRRNPIDRAVAARHMGYAGLSGAADKAIATMMHYGLMERVSKGEIRTSQLTLDILHPDSPDTRKRALNAAAFNPELFSSLRSRFPEGASEGALKSYLVREGFLERAIEPAVKAYVGTCSYLKQEDAYESDGLDDHTVEESTSLEPDDSDERVFGGAKPGDMIQWESGGALQFDKPCRVRAVSPDGHYVAIDGHNGSWVPMSEVIVQSKGVVPSPPPPLQDEAPTSSTKLAKGETEWMRNSLGTQTQVRLIVTGDMGPREIGKLIKLLEAQRSVLTDDDD